MYEYQALNAQKETLCEKLDNIEDEFIRNESPLYKERMLAVYKKMAPLKAPMLDAILQHISYGPVKIASLPLIDGGHQRFGSALYYKYKDPVSKFESPVLLVTYESAKGRVCTNLYGLTLHGHLTAAISEGVPLYWTDGMGHLHKKYAEIVKQSLESGIPSVAPEHRLLAFLSADRDLGECGDIYGAIPEYYDIQEKLKTGADYYWAERKSPNLVEQMRDVTEQILTLAIQDATENDWEKLQDIFQKAFVALSCSSGSGST